jgi:hypothetical protein
VAGLLVGRWEGDNVAVETKGFNDKGGLDTNGHPVTDALHVIERYTRKDFGHMDVAITIDDPKVYTRPWTVVEPAVTRRTPNSSSTSAKRTTRRQHMVGKCDVGSTRR